VAAVKAAPKRMGGDGPGGSVSWPLAAAIMPLSGGIPAWPAMLVAMLNLDRPLNAGKPACKLADGSCGGNRLVAKGVPADKPTAASLPLAKGMPRCLLLRKGCLLPMVACASLGTAEANWNLSKPN